MYGIYWGGLRGQCRHIDGIHGASGICTPFRCTLPAHSTSWQELANRDADDETTVHDWARAAFALVMSNHCDAEGYLRWVFGARNYSHQVFAAGRRTPGWERDVEDPSVIG